MAKKITISLISLYQIFISPIFKILTGAAASCRFEETCSSYAKRQILEKGVFAGLSLGLIRLAKCQPFYTGDLRKETV